MNWDWHGIAGLVLALGIAISLVGISIIEIGHDGHFTEAEATTVAAVLGAAIGALATYLGQGRDRK